VRPGSLPHTQIVYTHTLSRIHTQVLGLSGRGHWKGGSEAWAPASHTDCAHTHTHTHTLLHIHTQVLGLSGRGQWKGGSEAWAPAPRTPAARVALSSGGINQKFMAYKEG
jgi:hypothetical protein